MTPIVSVFAASPDRGRGLARDMAVRWALAEVGQDHELRLLSFAELKTPEHKARQPFGQIPTYETDGLTLFESGAIVLHIAETHGLLPTDPAARARTIAWMFAAVSTIEPVIVEREVAVLLAEPPWPSPAPDVGEVAVVLAEPLRLELLEEPLLRSLRSSCLERSPW